MSTHPIRAFYPNGRIQYEYFRQNGTIRDLRCWEENGEPIEQKDIKYREDDSDEDLAIRFKYICKKMPVPNFERTPSKKSWAVVMSKNGPYYLGVDF